VRQGKAKKKLEEAIAAKLEGFVAWEKGEERTRFEEIETQALAAGQEMIGEMLAWAAKEEKAKEKRDRAGAEPECESCGRRLRYRGEKKRGLVSKAGMIEIERGYYECPTCGAGFFPPGPATGD
jgi:rubrerythrin